MVSLLCIFFKHQLKSLFRWLVFLIWSLWPLRWNKSRSLLVYFIYLSLLSYHLVEGWKCQRLSLTSDCLYLWFESIVICTCDVARTLLGIIHRSSVLNVETNVWWFSTNITVLYTMRRPTCIKHGPDFNLKINYC